MVKKTKAQIASYLPLIITTLIIIFLLFIYLFFGKLFFIGESKVEVIKERIDRKTENYNLLYSIIYSDLNDKEKKEIEGIGNANHFYDLFYLYPNSSNEEKDKIKRIIEERFDKYLLNYALYVYSKDKEDDKGIKILEINKLKVWKDMIKKFLGETIYIFNFSPQRISYIVAEKERELLKTSAQFVIPYTKNKLIIIFFITNE